MGNPSENKSTRKHNQHNQQNQQNRQKQCKRHVCVGILAHVDAGKTTLSEGILYLTGNIRKLGRVDHGDAFLDTEELERSRGITIFSKQAVFDLGTLCVTLLDTPGHVDFSAEMERTLQVLDYAVLVINGADGVQGHTRTLWRLLERYRIPTFLFVNKMDQPGTDESKLCDELSRSLSEGCVSFHARNWEREAFFESAAMCGEEMLEEYLEKGEISDESIVAAVKERRLFPCYFGSALKVEGVQEFLDGIERYITLIEDEKVAIGRNTAKGRNAATGNVADSAVQFGARVFKISRDPQGNRLTHMKITSGTLHVKESLKEEEKVNQIRIYSGEKYELVQSAVTGMVCAVTGLESTYAGEGLGAERESARPVLEPVLNYQIQLPKECDVHTMLKNLRQLEEEDPMLRIVWNEELGEIYAQLMGEVQIEVLQSLILERFGVSVTFGTGNIVYKEMIENTTEGVGHYEPLRHYAEVHLILEPGEAGSGLVFDSECSEDELDKNWQRLILTHLMEKPHRGVLTGAEITDMKITLAAGRAHLKHTEGGDFRQSTYRAVRQGLMQAKSVLLEPYYEFRLEVPSEFTGRAMTDIQRMYGESEPPLTDGEMTVLSGTLPVSEAVDYPREVISYTKGRGRISLEFKGYAPCHNAEQVIEASAYDPERDTDNPTGSVFCAHGAGYFVPWDEVFSHMHIESQLAKRKRSGEEDANGEGAKDFQADAKGKKRLPAGKEAAQRPVWNEKEEKELEEIFIRTYGRYDTKPRRDAKTVYAAPEKRRKKKEENLTEYLLVDGYNVIFAWDELKELARDNIEGARGRLLDILCNYQGYKKCVVIAVFDAYKVEGYALEIQKYHNIHVVYTKEAETADQYIEKVVHEIGRKYHVTVVTSDGVEQVVTLGQGGKLISAREFYEEVEIMRREIEETYAARKESGRNYLFDSVDEELAKEMEDVRLGRKELGEKERKKEK